MTFKITITGIDCTNATSVSDEISFLVSDIGCEVIMHNTLEIVLSSNVLNYEVVSALSEIRNADANVIVFFQG